MARKITSIGELKKLSDKAGGIDVFILLNGGLRSSKNISYEGGRWRVESFMDPNITSLGNTNVREAIKKGALYLDE